MKKIISALIAFYSAFAFSATTVPVQLLNPTGSTSGQAIVSTGASSAPAWGGIGLSGISAIAANTMVGNGTGSSATPAAITMPSCSTAGTALQWTSGTGFTCASGYASSSGPGAFTTLSASGNDALLYTNVSGQSIPNNSTTTITGWTKTFDRVNANFNASTGVFTAPATGIYQISAGITFVAHTGSVNNQYSLIAIAGGSAVAQTSYFRQTASSVSVPLTLSATVSMTSGQTMILQVIQTSGAAVALLNSTVQNFISISRLP